jgi:MarR family transcriptional regulator, 2-MHQ and catechol-resistance regulon repressor
VWAVAPAEKGEFVPTPEGVTVWLALWRVTRDIDRIAQDNIASLGLCPTDFGALEILLNRGPTPVNAIAESVMITSGSMTTAVDRLVAKGLACRKAHARDARVRLVELTDEGRALIEPAYAAHAEAIEQLFEPLSAEERSALLTSLLKLRHSTRPTKGPS